MRNPYEVLKQKEKEMAEIRCDLSALYRVVPLLAEKDDLSVVMPQKRVVDFP